MATIISGKEVAAKVRAEIKKDCEALDEMGITPGLAVIIVGDDPASRVYVNNKKKACEEVGFVSEEYALPAETTQEELLALIHRLNGKPDIDGILCQLPLPKHLDEKAVINVVTDEKQGGAFCEELAKNICIRLIELDEGKNIISVAVDRCVFDKNIFAYKIKITFGLRETVLKIGEV